MSMFQSKKPYSSVTVQIERLTSESYDEEDLSGIPDLVEVIKLQATGPTEAARALRKKLKYGTTHRQLRALTLLNGLIVNGGSRFQRTFVDEPLLERLRVCGTSNLVDRDVREKCKLLFAAWARDYKKTPGMERIVALHKEMPRRKQVVTQERSKVLKETERDPFEGEDDVEQSRPDQASSSSPKPSSSSSRPDPTPVKTHKSKGSSSAFGSSSSGFGSSFFGTSSTVSKSKEKSAKGKSKRKPFNLEAEKDKMKTNIAESSIASTNLLNSMQRINREQERVSENAECQKQFERCKMLRRHILRYIQHIETEDWLGALIQANDQLITALMTFEQLDRSIDADSDSDDELAEQAHAYRMLAERAEKEKSTENVSSDLASLKIESPPPPPPRPAAPPRPVSAKPQIRVESDSEEEDENNPFGDSNALETPANERDEPKWR